MFVSNTLCSFLIMIDRKYYIRDHLIVVYLMLRIALLGFVCIKNLWLQSNFISSYGK